MKQRRIIAAVSFALVASVIAAACGGGSGDGSEDGTATKGGTIHILSNGEQIAHLDPQRNYTGDDLAFADQDVGGCAHPTDLAAPGGTGVVDIASTSGIELLDGLRPWDADTTGFGQAIAAALQDPDVDARKIGQMLLGQLFYGAAFALGVLPEL